MEGTMKIFLYSKFSGETETFDYTSYFDKTVIGSQGGVQLFNTDIGGNGIDYGDLDTPGKFAFKNMEPVTDPPTGNFIEIGLSVSGTFYPFLVLNPGEICCGTIADGASLFARADTASVKLRVFILEGLQAIVT